MHDKKISTRRVRLGNTLRQRELDRADAIWQRSTDYRRYLILIYVVAFLLLFHFLSGSSFFAQLLHEFQHGRRTLSPN